MTYKFGGAAVADAERMVEVARLICHFQDQAPVVVMSAMGKVGNSKCRHNRIVVICSQASALSLSANSDIIA